MPHPKRFQLTIQLGPEPGLIHMLTGDLVTIGRYSGNTIIIPDEQVSRIHARLTRTADGYTIEDLNSSNGLFVNNTRVSRPVPLSSGDLVRLGTSVVLVYEAFASGAVTPIAARLASNKEHSTRPVSDTSGTIYMKKGDMQRLQQGKKQSIWGRLFGWMRGKR